ncbi:MAG: ABC transporter ATP-binding protein/permease [Clostridia bacterium]|nr:ABC transporter ATP-binding protein/permease [Clostridia bacterium]
MLKLTNIRKDYVTGDSVVHALNGVSLQFRESEFVSILGPSGCGKTTLLNIIGGLDNYTSGDLIINEKSTKKFEDRDWDTYRNHSVGFVFQSYNLIPHQSVLSNVELALTLSGVDAKERRTRAIEALTKVGLGDQIHKKPNQMSGGQMQRVAIARALVNDPDILLADEPTGALDSTTSVQIMEILKEISNDRLIIMVTHNPELAKEYSTRIINLLDGQIISDSRPYYEMQEDTFDLSRVDRVLDTAPVNTMVDEDKNRNVASLEVLPPSDKMTAPKREKVEASTKKATNKGKKAKTSMSFLTALLLSLNNLLTKKGRTFLTSFAGSIGIIGIALILSVSTGVNAYISSVEESTMSSYPIEINESTMDTMTLLGSLMEQSGRDEEDIDKTTIYSNDIMIKVMNTVANGATSNNLTAFRDYIENDSQIKPSSTDVKYLYNTRLNTYTIIKNDKGEIVTYRKNITDFAELMAQIGLGDMFGSGGASSMLTTNAWTELVGDSDYISSQYDVLYGKYPSADSSNEVVLIVDSKQQVSDYILYTLGIRDIQELKNWVSTRTDTIEGNETEIPEASFSFEDILGYEFKVLPDSEKYKVVTENGITKIEERKDIEIQSYLASDDAMTLKVVGIVTPSENSASSAMIGAIGYTSALASDVLGISNGGDVVSAQKQNNEINLLNGLKFEGYAPDCKYLRDLISQNELYAPYVKAMSDEQIIEAFENMLGSSIAPITKNAPYGGYTLKDALSIKMQILQIEDQATKLAAMALMNTTDDNFIRVINSMLDNTSYEAAMEKIGSINLDTPTKILIYPKDFDSKEIIKAEISDYNKEAERLGRDSDKITYSDTVALLMSSVTTIIDAITYVLVAFVSISLIVSSIMIGIITYISVLERTKEIGILRAIGASKKDISRVFNAETLIVGFGAGFIGILVTLIFNVIINVILYSLTGLASLKATLGIVPAIVLILISMILTLVAGLIPARVASKKDPVIALRSE